MQPNLKRLVWGVGLAMGLILLVLLILALGSARKELDWTRRASATSGSLSAGEEGQA